MSKFDQRNQKVEKQINVNISTTEKLGASELVKRGIQLVQIHEYRQAVDILKQAISLEPSVANAQYYIALALLNGQRPRLLPLITIQEIQRRLRVSVQQDDKCSHAYVLWAIVKEDYYVMNGLYDVGPSPIEILSLVTSINPIYVNEILTHIHAPKNRVWEWLCALS